MESKHIKNLLDRFIYLYDILHVSLEITVITILALTCPWDLLGIYMYIYLHLQPLSSSWFFRLSCKTVKALISSSGSL